MNLSKLRKIHIIIIGTFLCIAAGTAIFFFLIKPQQEAYADAKRRYEEDVKIGNDAMYNAAIKARDEAIVARAQAEQALERQMRQRMPNLSFARREIGMLELWNEQIRTLGPLLENYARDKKVKVPPISIKIPPPPVNPNSDVFEKDVLEFKIGPIVAIGDFKSLMNHLRRWNGCRRLVMVNNPKLTGVSPSLVMQYDLKCYIFPAVKAGPEKIPIAGNP